jgi:hypothetical protein
VLVYDYVDQNVPVLAKMAAKRRKAYQSIGYRISSSNDSLSIQQPILVNPEQPISRHHARTQSSDMTGFLFERKCERRRCHAPNCHDDPWPR